MSILNNPDLVGFYALGAVAIFASLRVVIHANPVHAILSMIVSLLAVAGILFILGAPFAGALEIVVYAGAILVLFVFVIMMLNLGMANETQEERWLDAKTWAIPTGLTFIIAVVLYALIGSNHDDAAVVGGITVPAKVVGTVLFSKYIMLVEVAALLLLAALVAAYHLGKQSLNDEVNDNELVGLHHNGSNVNDAVLTHSDAEINHSNSAVDSAAKPSPAHSLRKGDVNEDIAPQEVDPYDYVGMQHSSRKELD